MPIIAAKLLAGLTRISTDTRTLKSGDIFIALSGENFDGHDYIDAALKVGASLVIAERAKLNGRKVVESLEDIMGIVSPAARNDTVRHCEESSDEAIHILAVDSSVAAYQLLAKTYRRLANPIVVAITGSSGKTTTKEMMRLVLAERYRVHYSQANLNNEIGVPQTIVAMPFDTQVLVVEMGMRGLGQIEELSLCAEPNISVIVNIGSAHIELLGSLENIRKAKLEIVAGMIARPDLAPVLCVDTKLYNHLVSEPSLLQAHVQPKGKDWKLNVMAFDDSRHYVLNGLAGAAIHSDANAVAAVAKVLGLNDAEIRVGLSKYNPSRGRGSYHHDAAGNLIIDDSYNANPDSLRASVDAVCEQYAAENKILVLGELMESLSELVADVVKYVSSRMTVIDARGREIPEVLSELRSSLDGKTVVLVKGSRASKLERVVEAFLE